MMVGKSSEVKRKMDANPAAIKNLPVRAKIVEMYLISVPASKTEDLTDEMSNCLKNA